MAIDRLGRIFACAAAVSAVAGITHSAFADGPAPIPSPPAVQAANWTGLYAGGEIGALFESARHFRPTTGLADSTIGSIDSRPTYGFYGGFNYQFLPWLVAGVEYDHTKFSEATYRELGPGADFLDLAQRVDSVSGRLGFLLMPTTMIYGKLGAARMQVQSFNAFGPGTFERSLPGVQSGVGVETLVTPNIALRAEASYTYADRLLAIPNAPFDLYRPAFLMFQVGLAFKLDAPAGWGVPATAPALTMAALKIQDLWSLWSPAAPPAPIVTKAHGMVTKAPPPAVAAKSAGAPNWTGLEAGGFISANGNKAEFNDTVLGQSGPFTDFAFGGGWFAGANWQIQRIVVGAEVSGNYEAGKFNNATAGTPVPGFGKIDRVLAVAGRVGWLLTPETLLYAKGGPADMRFTPDHAFWNAIAPNNTSAQHFSGYEAGAGVETYVLPNLSVRAEGLYTYSGRKEVLQGPVPNEFTVRPSLLSATLGLALHI